ncbi:MAG: ABC transporter ATP-binding protein [bacterium]
MKTPFSDPGRVHVRDAMQLGRPMSNRRIEKARDTRHALGRLLSYLSHHKVAMGAVFALILLTTGLGLIGPYLLGVAIDRFISVQQAAGLGRIALLMLAVYLATNLFQALSGWIMSSVSQGVLNRLRRELFGQMQHLPISFFDRQPAGELMSRLTNDIDAINHAVSQNVTILLSSVLSLAGILLAMFALDFRLALASLLVTPIMFLFTVSVARFTRRGFRDLQEQLGTLNSVMEEAISGQKAVRAFQRTRATIDSFDLHNRRVFRAGVYANSYGLLLMPLTGVLGNFFIIVLAAFGGWLALRGLVTVGIIATFIIYAHNFIHPLRQLANMYNAIQSALAGAERIFDIIDEPAEVDAAPTSDKLPSLQGKVRFEHVAFAYQPLSPVINNMSFETGAGQTIALVGPTGAGKTTMINLLTRFYEIDAGQVTIDGRDIRNINKTELRRQMGLVLQDTFLFSGTVMENIRFGRLDASDQECIEAARLAEADLFIRQLPRGYQSDLSERAANLSQGQRQLLAIARAILANPRILILDEATSNVDTRTEIRIQTALLRIMARRTSFVIAHRLRTVRDADLVLVIREGQIIEKGTHDQLLAKQGFYHHLYLSQFKGEKI